MYISLLHVTLFLQSLLIGKAIFDDIFKELVDPSRANGLKTLKVHSVRPNEWRVLDHSGMSQSDNESCGVFAVMNSLTLMEGPSSSFRGQSQVANFRREMLERLSSLPFSRPTPQSEARPPTLQTPTSSAAQPRAPAPAAQGAQQTSSSNAAQNPAAHSPTPQAGNGPRPKSAPKTVPRPSALPSAASSSKAILRVIT